MPYMPHIFFNEKDRGALRCLMGAAVFKDGVCDKTGNWIELPGPMEWWVKSKDGGDAIKYFAKWGFAPRADLSEEYRKALASLESREPLAGWDAMIDHGCEFDLVWKQGFKG